jgi:hypothetical protein
MKRDCRLLASIILLLVSAALAVLHFNRVAWWHTAFAGQDFVTMQEEFGVVRANNCAYDCYGWGGYPGDHYWLPAIVAFVLGISLIAAAWLRPKTCD